VKSQFLLTVRLQLETDSVSGVVDAVNEILRPYLRAFASNSALLD
jgi:hypothetical protein